MPSERACTQRRRPPPARASSRRLVRSAPRASSRLSEQEDDMRKGESVVATLINGAIAGAVATWVMGKVTTQLYEREDKSAREREDQARGGEMGYGVAAQKAADAAGVTLSKERRQR